MKFRNMLTSVLGRRVAGPASVRGGTPSAEIHGSLWPLRPVDLVRGGELAEASTRPDGRTLARRLRLDSGPGCGGDFDVEISTIYRAVIHNWRYILAIFAILAGLFLSAARAESIDWNATPHRLMLVEQDGCVYSAAWHREIGESYPGSAEGRKAPLLRVSINGPYPNGIALARRPNVTPTFILLKNGQELSRIEGYPGAARFYPLVRDMLQGLP